MDPRAANLLKPRFMSMADNEYYLDDSQLRIGDVIVKPNSTETYTVSKRGGLIGVYNINKGYADFKQIQILYQNDEYSIVKSNTEYGLNVYDYIALNAEAVTVNDFIYEIKDIRWEQKRSRKGVVIKMIQENLKQVRDNIAAACERSGRDLHEVHLISVSKTKPVEMLQEAYAAGSRDFGENKVQEMCDKVPVLPADIRWHMIGHLQTNKIKYIIDKAIVSIV